MNVRLLFRSCNGFRSSIIIKMIGSSIGKYRISKLVNDITFVFRDGVFTINHEDNAFRISIRGYNG